MTQLILTHLRWDHESDENQYAEHHTGNNDIHEVIKSSPETIIALTFTLYCSYRHTGFILQLTVTRLVVRCHEMTFGQRINDS